MHPVSCPDVTSDIVKRMTLAADQLYEENGNGSFPNVDSVRRKARVNMNDASNVMRAWRRAQTAGAEPTQTPIPDAVHEASQAMLAGLWNISMNAASASLRAAQAQWEQERIEAETCREQLASAFDQQSEELLLAQHKNVALEQALESRSDELQTAAQQLDSLRTKLTEVENHAATAEIRSNEIAKRSDDLKLELSRAHASAEQARLEAKARLDTAEATIARLTEAIRQTSDRENATREELAFLRGQVEVMATERHSPLPPSRSHGTRMADSEAPVAVPGTRHVSRN
jgi:colicin import membrane protein